MRRARWIVLAASLAVLLVGVMLTSADLALIRRSYPMLSRSMSWLESLWPGGPDLEHVVLFAALAFLWRLLMPRARWLVVALILVVLALTTEALQYLTVGRRPRWSDVRDDVLGVALGLTLAVPFLKRLIVERPARRRRDAT